jgi:adenylate cyclase class 2
MAIETEKKYRLDKKRLVELSAKLAELGAEFIGETFEENYLHRGQVLDDRNAMLRLRKTGSLTLLTYKEKYREQADFKHKIEFETEVADVMATENIIEKLGYKLSVVYEKHRKTFHLGAVEVVLDELPFGFFMEIEGETNEIERAEKLLEIRDLEPEPRGYPRLTAKYGTLLKSGVYESRFAKNKPAKS